MLYDDAPEWVKAADAHAIAADNTSLFEDIVAGVEHTPSFLAVSIASGLNSFYNTGVAVGNVFLDEDLKFQENETGAWISSMDEDLGLYYQENKSAADLVGFIAGSFIPGTAAVKGLNAAQGAARVAAAGQVGSGFARATGLLAPSIETFVKREAGELAARSASFSFMHQNSLKSLAAGAWQGTLEGVAFETAVAATMFKSPILEDMDAGDLMKNMMLGAGVGAGFGAVAGAAQTYFGVGRLMQRVDQTAQPFLGSTQLRNTRDVLPSDKVVQAATDVEALGRLEPSAEFVYAQKKAAGETGESLEPHIIAGEVGRLQRERTANLQNFQNEIRTGFREMSSDDSLGLVMAEISDKLGPGGVQRVAFNTKQFVRAGETSDFEQLLKELVRDGTFKDLKAARKGMQNQAVTTHIKLHSGTIGEEVSGRVGVLRLADDFQPKKLDDLISRNAFKPSQRVDFRKLTDPRAAELRYLATRSSTLPVNWEKTVVGSHDIPVLEKAIKTGAERIKVEFAGGTRILNSQDEIKEYIILAKGEVLQAQQELGTKADVTEIIADVRKGFIEGVEDAKDFEKTFFAQRSYAMEASTFLGREIDEVALAKMPAWVKVVKDNRNLKDEDGMVLRGMAMIKARQKLAKQSVDNYMANYAGEIAKFFPEWPEDLLRSMWRGETGAGTFTSAGGAFGSVSSMASHTGDIVAELSKTRMTRLNEDFSTYGQKLLTSPEDAIRFSIINSIITSTPEKYVLDGLGENLIPFKFKQWIDGGQKGDVPVLFQGSPEVIPLESETVREAVAKWIGMNDSQYGQMKNLHAVQGNTDEKLAGVFRPFRPDPRDHKHVAFVLDETLVGAGHKRMLIAQSAEQLENMIAKVSEIGRYKIQRTTDTEAFFKSLGEYEFDKTLHENYLDTDLMSRGIMSNFLPPTDPQKIVNQMLGQLTRQENVLLKQSVRVRYEKEINELERMAKQWDATKGSRIGTRSIDDILSSSDKNPYTAMIKAMFNSTKIEEMPAWLRTTNQALDANISKAWNSASEVFNSAASKGNLSPEAIDRVNKIYDELGFKSAYADSATQLLANAKIPRGILSTFVRTSNAFLSTTLLRLDVFNAAVNKMGMAIMYAPEMKNVLDGIRTSDPTLAGKLAGIKLPGVDDSVFSPFKLLANSYQRLHGPDAQKLIGEYKARGFAPDLTDQYYKSLDAITLAGTESVTDMSKKSAQLVESAKAFAKWGEKATGNKWVEEFNRLATVDSLKQLTDQAVAKGVMTDSEAWAMLGTFNKRVNGVIRAAERPLMFQGPIGQAIGLFQSYQMNLMQQVFRNIGEGRGKTIAMMAGLQGSIFGASSLPGFNLINSALGSASGNTEHYDLFSATKTIFGQAGADWLMYGAASNILGASIYTRGNTNPRSWHVVPNPANPEEIPFISAYARVFSSLKNAAGQVADGAPLWNSFLSGVEHLGISRPLAGIAQTGRALDGGKVISTQLNGNIAGSNDFLSLSTLIRLAGAKPLDEAIVSDAYFRNTAYREADNLRREKLGSAIKGKIMAGEELGPEEIGDFARDYIGMGGKQTGFNQWWMNQYKNATVPQSQQMARDLQSPYARRMQEVMGGRDSLFNIN